MQRFFTDENENFEEFLQQNADGLRMTPTARVWKGISKQLNKRRRRAGFIIAFSLLITSGLGYYLSENTTANTADATTLTKINSTSKENIVAPTSTPITVFQNNNNTASGVKVKNKISDQPELNFIATQNFQQRSNLLNVVTKGSSIESGNQSIVQNDFVPTIVDSYPVDETSEKNKSVTTSTPSVLKNYPQTIESVVNHYQPKLKNKKLSFQVFFTPTVSYRRLTENKAYTKTTSFLNAPSTQQSLYNINNAVTHKPDFGFELGTTAKYKVGNKFKLRAGLQLNISRYDIKTFTSSYQLSTIRFRNNDSLNTISGFNNFNGYKSDWLQNFYFQISAPLGVEYRIAGNGKTEIGVATTIQPTYLLNDRAYMITSDYKTYVEVPWLVRQWNVNTSVETYVSYSTGKIKWQVGPQVRYQLQSSFIKKYPVKENLFDFGLKVGMSLNK